MGELGVDGRLILTLMGHALAQVVIHRPFNLEDRGLCLGQSMLDVVDRVPLR